tara:strand:- start:16086 stop:17822 length:1737 start_codon:yes stop_codon:yes gene_type:complete
MYANRLINEAEVQKTWTPIISEATGIEDKSKLAWMSKYCHYHNLNESVYNTVHLNPNMNLQGMNAPAFPNDPTTLNAFPGQVTGSGDKPFSLLPLAMQVAAQTVGLDLVPVVPMQGPMGVLTYLDFVYGGGRIQDAGGKATDSAPLMIKFAFDNLQGAALVENDLVYASSAALTTTVAPYELTFIGLSRIDGKSIFRVRGNDDATATTAGVYQQGEVGYEPIYDAIANNVDFYDAAAAQAGDVKGTVDGNVELVKALEDHIPGFSGSAFEANNPVGSAPTFGVENIGGVDPYQRGVGEATPDNNLGLSLFNKSVAAMTYQVAAAVTREQVQDLKQFGIDAVAQVEAVLVNELTQSINKLILDRIFKLGVTNAFQVSQVNGTVLSAHFDLTGGVGTTIALGQDNTGTARSVTVDSVNVAGGGETQGTLQRRILTKILAATNLIAVRGRRGPATFAVTSGKMATAIQDVAGFVPYPLSNTVNQAGGSLYPIGAVAGVTIYVDPNRDFDDNKIAVGRKGDGNSPGLVFMPYLMAESVETIAEGTMAPKIAVKSRFALVEAGFHPQTMYYTLDFVLTGVDLI